MTDDKSISVINAGGLAKPADTLIKKVSAAVGGVFEPWQIKRVARAEADAKLIAAQAEIDVTDLHRRATRRWFEEEARRQENMEEITRKAIQNLDADSNPNGMDDDWITNFFEKARIVSDKEMQDLWARVLASESNHPGSYSKRTVNMLGDLDKRDAEAFAALCRFSWIVEELTPLVFDISAPIYGNNGINFGVLSHLDSIGLIHFNDLTGFLCVGLPKTIEVAYAGRPLKLEFAQASDNQLEIGKVLFTQAGTELARICPAAPVPEFEEYVGQQWKAYLSKKRDGLTGGTDSAGQATP